LMLHLHDQRDPNLLPSYFAIETQFYNGCVKRERTKIREETDRVRQAATAGLPEHSPTKSWIVAPNSRSELMSLAPAMSPIHHAGMAEAMPK